MAPELFVVNHQSPRYRQLFRNRISSSNRIRITIKAHVVDGIHLRRIITKNLSADVYRPVWLAFSITMCIIRMTGNNDPLRYFNNSLKYHLNSRKK